MISELKTKPYSICPYSASNYRKDVCLLNGDHSGLCDAYKQRLAPFKRDIICLHTQKLFSDSRGDICGDCDMNYTDPGSECKTFCGYCVCIWSKSRITTKDLFEIANTYKFKLDLENLGNGI